MTIWRNGAFHKVYIKTKISTGAGGGEIHEIGDASSQADIERQLPPIDHTFDGVQPTAAQAQAARDNANAEQSRLNGTPSGGPAGAESSSPGPAAP